MALAIAAGLPSCFGPEYDIVHSFGDAAARGAVASAGGGAAFDASGASGSPGAPAMSGAANGGAGGFAPSSATGGAGRERDGGGASPTSAGGARSDAGELAVVSVTPRDGATAVERNAAVEVDFSSDVDPLTATDRNVQLLDGSTPIGGAVVVRGTRVTFTPSVRLDLLARYTLVVGAGVAGISGAVLPESYSTSFTVRDGTWSPPIDLRVAMDGGSYGSPVLAVNSDGVTAVWVQSDGVYLRAYAQGAGWGAAKFLDQCFGDCNMPAVALPDVAGRPLVAWMRTTGPSMYVVAYRNGLASRVDMHDSTTHGALVAFVANSGEEHLLWDTLDSTHPGGDTIAHAHGVGLPPLTVDETFATEYAGGLAATLDGSGNVLSGYFTSSGDVVLDRYDATAKTTTATPIGHVPASPILMQMKEAGNGTPFLVLQALSDGRSLYASSFDAAKGWSDLTSFQVPVNTQISPGAFMALPDAARVQVLFSERNAADELQLVGYSTSGWGKAAPIAPLANFDSLHGCFDHRGNGIALFGNDAGPFFVRYVQARGAWSVPSAAPAPGATSLGAFPDGSAIAVFATPDGPRAAVFE